FYKTFVARSLKKAKVIITFSEFSQAEIIKQYKINGDKTAIVYKGISQSFREITNEERENVKAKYADGNEYFIYTGEIGSVKNLLNLLKAFSAFKKRQQSNMQLLIFGNPSSKTEAITEALRLFRFKKDVQLLTNEPIEELAKVTAAAYAMVYPSCYDNFATQPLQAMISGVPVIISSTGAMTEICADAALYADPENFKEIAIRMMTLFKDENLRKTLIEKGKIQAKKYDWDITAALLWELIEKS
ncbi:MAG: glycosyltransferase family 1 protein, partial [Ginsengibacter sp.]